MIPLSAQQVADVVGGSLVVPSGTPAPQVTGIARIDSRDTSPGDLFVAVLGDSLDGHDYVEQAREGGAVLSLVSRTVPGPHVIVDDVIAALTELARHNAAALPSTCSVIAITGSSGKTSTKDLLAAVLEADGPTIAPPGSFNNEIGMPLTVLRAGAHTRYLVLEMGARGVGHIAWLCGIARPHVALVLNVGSAHLGEFGDVETIAAAKGELVESLTPNGVAVLNADDSRVLAMATRTKARVVTFGSANNALARASDITLDNLGRASFTLHTPGVDGVMVALEVSGRHMVANALAAAAVAIALGLEPQAVASALSSAPSRSPWRMEVTTTSDGVTVINDSYNANPESMAAALRATADIAGDRRIGLVLGEMLELGASSQQAHVEVGALAREIGADWVVAVGSAAEPVGEGAGPGLVVSVDDAAAAISSAHDAVKAGDVVLVKASRGVGLEVVAAALLDQLQAGGAA